MGCGSSSSRAASPAQKKSKEPHDEALETNHTDTQRILKESIETNLSNTTKENKYNNNDNEKQKTNPKIHQEQELVMPSKVQENDTNITNLSMKKSAKENGKSLPTTGVAFEVKFDEDSRVKDLRQPKLQKLENITVLTADMLAKKQATADENRHKEIQRKLAKTSKRKKQLLEAREIDKAQEKRTEIEEKMDAQNKKRSRVQAEIIAKQRRREERAQQVRAKAERIREGGDMANFDVDPDETYNADEEADESWDTNRTLSNKSQLVEQVQSENKQATENDESVYDFFEE